MSALIASILLFAGLVQPNAYEFDELWDVRMQLRIPRVYNNTESKGYRRYQAQAIRGMFAVTHRYGMEPIISFVCLSNLTHKISGACVTYSTVVYPSDTMWHGIGNNKLGDFRTHSVAFKIEAEPSYVIGEKPTEDNTMILVLAGYSGHGSDVIRGYAAGQLGCGCKDYGHISPTRIWNQPDMVMDTAAVFGTWRAAMIFDGNDAVR